MRRAAWLSIAGALAGCGGPSALQVPTDIDFVGLVERDEAGVRIGSELYPSEPGVRFDWDGQADAVIVGFRKARTLLEDVAGTAPLRVADRCEPRLPPPEWTYELRSEGLVEDLPALTTDDVVTRCAAQSSFSAPVECYPCVHEPIPCEDIEVEVNRLEIDVEAPQVNLHGVAWLPADRAFIADPWIPAIGIVDPRDPVLRDPLPTIGLDRMQDVAYDGDRRVILGSGQGVAAIYDLQGAAPQFIRNLGASIRVAAGRDGSVFTYGSSAPAFELTAGSTVAVLQSDFPSDLVSMAVDTRARIAALDVRGVLHLRQGDTWTAASEAIEVSGDSQLAFTEAGVAATSAFSSPTVFDVEQGRWLALNWPYRIDPRALAAFAGGVAVASTTGRVLVYRGSVVCHLEEQLIGVGAINDLDASPDGSQMYGVTSALAAVGSVITFRLIEP